MTTEAPTLADIAKRPKHVIALMLWRERLRNPELSVIITEADVRGLTDCLAHQKLEAEVVMHPHPRGLVVTLVEKGTQLMDGEKVTSPGNAITPMENNAGDFERSQEAAKLRRMREAAPGLASQLQKDLSSGTFSSSTITEACEALVALARAA